MFLILNNNCSFLYSLGISQIFLVYVFATYSQAFVYLMVPNNTSQLAFYFQETDERFIMSASELEANLEIKQWTLYINRNNFTVILPHHRCDHECSFNCRSTSAEIITWNLLEIYNKAESLSSSVYTPSVRRPYYVL